MESIVTVSSEDLCPNYVRSFVQQEVKGVDIQKREITHQITTGAVDRAGDVVESGGAQVVNFLKNPVVMADHSYSIEKIIGKAISIEVSPKGITATTRFRDTMLADEAFRIAQEGIGGWSIGFQPMDSHSLQDGAKSGCKTCKSRFAALAEGKSPGEYVPGAYSRHFMSWDLLEYSSVAIPMNQDIVNNAIQRGLVSRENAPVFFRSITPEPTTEVVAAQGPTVEAVELHPVLANALKRAEGRSHRLFALAAVERATREALEKIHGSK